jgi:hypothetical protein
MFLKRDYYRSYFNINERFGRELIDRRVDKDLIQRRVYNENRKQKVILNTGRTKRDYQEQPR